MKDARQSQNNQQVVTRRAAFDILAESKGEDDGEAGDEPDEFEGEEGGYFAGGVDGGRGGPLMVGVVGGSAGMFM